MSEDLIRREDAIETAYQLRHKPNDEEWGDWLKSFNAIPSADRPQDDDGTLSVSVEDATKVKRVLVEDGESGDLYYADRPKGEWKSVKASIYPYGYDVECSICGHRMGSSFGYKFCPMCGADMRKGADDE